MGLHPVSPVSGRIEHPRLLPRADVIHGPNFAALAHRRATAVITVHDLAFMRFPDDYPPGVAEGLNAAVQDAVRRDAWILCDSEATRADVLERYRPPADRCRRVYLGIDDEFFADAPHDLGTRLARLGATEPYLLHVGALVPRKDVGTLLAAFELLSEEHQEITVVLAGTDASGWLSDPSVSHWLTQHPALAQRVVRTGYVRDADILALTHGAAALVSTSRWEGFGLTIGQALAAGTPVVASRVSSLPEVGGSAAWYAAPGDAGDFAATIDRALREPSDKQAARKYDGARQAARFRWTTTAEETMAVYRLAARER